jgi:acyl carrier protein
MIPSFFVQLDNIPLTPNGKVNISALPDPEPGIGKGIIPPGNEVEEKLAGIWAEILGVEKDTIGIDTNFFESGGHSLNAAVMVAKVHKELNLKLSLAEVFEMPILKDLASLVTVVDWTSGNDQKIEAHQDEEEITI